jgi:acyl dehydratase
MKMLYLEDLKVGDQFKSREYELTLNEIQEFASKYDPQPFHLEESTSDHPVFDSIVASGWQTSAITMRLWTECFPIAKGLIGSESSLRWPKPARVGDRLRVELEIVAITPSKTKSDRGIVSYVTQTKNQYDDVLLISTTKILVFRSQLS